MQGERLGDARHGTVEERYCSAKAEAWQSVTHWVTYMLPNSDRGQDTRNGKVAIVTGRSYL